MLQCEDANCIFEEASYTRGIVLKLTSVVPRDTCVGRMTTLVA